MSFTYPTVTISTVSYPVYASVVTADAYFAARAGSTWDDYSSLEKSQGLRTATLFLDRQRWAGAKTDSTNTLAWPRTGVLDVDGVAVDSATLPAALQYACCELAAALLADASILSTATGAAQNAKRLKAGTAEVEFFAPVAGSRLPTAAFEWVSSFFGGAPGGVSGGFATGADGCSDFDDTCQWDVTR